MDTIKLAVVGIGNCASSLIQGFEYYRHQTPTDAIGLMHWDIGGYTPSDFEVVAAFDIDQRKVGLPVNQAIFAEPNCTQVFCDQLPDNSVPVSMGKVLDGLAAHMDQFSDQTTFLRSDAP